MLYFLPVQCMQYDLDFISIMSKKLPVLACLEFHFFQAAPPPGRSKQDRSDHATTAGHLLYVVYCDERVPIDLHRTLPYIKSFDRAYLGRMACRKLHCQLTTYKRSLSQPLVNCNGGKLEFIAYFMSAGTTTLPGIPLSKALSLAAGMT